MWQIVLFLTTLFILGVSAQQRIYEGQTVNILTMSGGIGTLVSGQAEAFFEATGASVNVDMVSRDELIQGMAQELRDGSPFYDVFVYSPQWMVDFVDCQDCDEPVMLLPIGERVRSDISLEWNDVFLYYRSRLTNYGSEIYSIPFDGDFHMMYYREDVLNELGLLPPRTWEEFLTVAEAADGLDMNGDGQPDHGACVAKKGKQVGYWMFWSVASSFLQSKGTEQGSWFDPETMEPMVQNDGFKRALEIYKALGEFGGPNPNEAALGDEDLGSVGTRSRFFELGECALYWEWGSLGSAAPQFRPHIRVAPLPGSRRVVQRRSDGGDGISLVECEQVEGLCPHAGDGINVAPFFANGGWVGSVSNFLSADRENAAYDYLSLLGSPAVSGEDVKRSLGFEVFRTSHLSDPQEWLDTGQYEAEGLQSYFETIEFSLDNPNAVADLGIRENAIYETQIMDELLTAYLNDELSVEQMQQSLHDQWEAKTEEIGRRNQINVYRATLGLQPLRFDEEVEVSKAARGIIITLASLVIAISLVLAVLVFVYRDLKVWRYASPLFMYGSLLGALLGAIAIVLYSLNPTDSICTAAVWLLQLGFALLISNVLAKTFRTWQIFRNVNKFRAVALSNKDILPIVFVAVLVSMAVLITWSAVDAPSALETNLGVGNFEYIVICDCKDYGLEFFVTLVAIDMALLLCTLFLSFTTRNTSQAFNESKTLSLIVYNCTQVLIIVCVSALAIDDPTARYILISISILFGFTVSIGLLFLPKVWKSIRGRGDEVEVSGTRNSTRSNSVRAGQTTAVETGSSGEPTST